MTRHDPGRGVPVARVPRERVPREARALARLSHPHVVTIHHIVDEGTFPWLVMELLRGESLQSRLARGPWSPATSRPVPTAARSSRTSASPPCPTRPRSPGPAT
ncbi:hypothetical protein [Streptomyces hebeiensis]